MSSNVPKYVGTFEVSKRVDEALEVREHLFC